VSSLGRVLAGAAVLGVAGAAGALAMYWVLRPAAPVASGAFAAGAPLGVTHEEGFTPVSAGVRVFGAVVNAESCVHDAERDLIVVLNRGAPQHQAVNDGFASLLNPDGSVHTPRWIGATRDGLVLNHPFGSEIAGGVLHVADVDGGTGRFDPQVAVLRRFDMATGAPVGEVRVEGATWLNDVAVAPDGSVYATQTGDRGDGPDRWRVWRISPAGEVSVFLQGAPLDRPNGVALTEAGEIVVVNSGDDAVLTFSPDGALIATERAAQAGGDGIAIMPDGTKYVSSVGHGGVSRIRPGEPAELIAEGIPAAASLCLDPVRGQLVIPMNENSALAFVPLD